MLVKPHLPELSCDNAYERGGGGEKDGERGFLFEMTDKHTGLS